MAKKAKLVRALASYQKRQVEKERVKRRNEAEEERATSQKGIAFDKKKVPSAGADDYVPCHIWTDSASQRMRTRLPFHPNFLSVVLLCGEGDFGYCRALAEIFERESAEQEEKTWRIIGTTLDSQTDTLAKYSQSRANLEFLQQPRFAGRVDLVFDVDATRLHENKSLHRLLSGRPPTRVIFNFPHTGCEGKDRKRVIVSHQQLLLDFFTATVEFMRSLGVEAQGPSNKRPSPNTCSYSTTMLRKELAGVELVFEGSQTGREKTVMSDAEYDDENGYLRQNAMGCDFDEKRRGEAFELHLTLLAGEPCDEWNAKGLAAKTGSLVCTQSFKFDPALYPGYMHCRTVIKGNNGVETGGDEWKKLLAGRPPKTFVFVLQKPSVRSSAK